MYSCQSSFNEGSLYTYESKKNSMVRTNGVFAWDENLITTSIFEIITASSFKK